MKDEKSCSHNGGGYSYLRQGVAIHLNHRVYKKQKTREALYINCFRHLKKSKTSRVMFI